MQQMGMSVKRSAINAFSTVDGENVHVAIVSTIASELWNRHPTVHFQALGPAKGIKIPGEPNTVTQATITFTFAKSVYYCDKQQNLNHVGTIQIDNGICVLRVTDPTSSSYGKKVYLLDKQWPLEFPGFPDVLYEELAPVLGDVVGSPKRQAEMLNYLYEVRKKSNPADHHTPLRHLALRFDTDPVKTLCGQKMAKVDVKSIQPSYDFTRDGVYCANCRESRIYKQRRGEL
jgi:hypothetical protein